MKSYNDKGLVGACLEISNNNYGSMLQSFATQKIFDKYNINYELLLYKKKYTPLFILKSIPRILNRVVWQEKYNVYQKKRFLKKHPELALDVKKRSRSFEKFRKDYFLSPIVTYCGYSQLKEASKKYSAFVTGSDQLWSPSGLPTNFYNLMFTYDRAIRISYASSFGVKNVPWYQIHRTKKFLDRIQFISCREKSGSDIVKKITGREVPTVVDPTFLFDGDTWKKQIHSGRVQEGEYIFSYMLGTDKKNRKEVIKLSKKTGLPIVSIHQYVDADLDFGDVSVADAGPAEFLDLIRNAEYVCTDSFHGSVFSVIFHKKFVVFNRYSDNNGASKNTRIDNLCEMLGISDRRFSGNICKDMLDEIDYFSIDKILKKVREESMDYIEKSFESIN